MTSNGTYLDQRFPRTGKVENWSLDRDAGALALRRSGGAVLALDDGFYFLDFEAWSDASGCPSA